LDSEYRWEDSKGLWIGNGIKYEYTYDANGCMTLCISYYWNETTSKWDLGMKEESTYDSKGNLSQIIYYYWNAFNNRWDAQNKTSYYYSDHDITNIFKTPETHFTIYPNPATNKITITTAGKSQGEIQVIIFSINGQVIQSDKFQNADRFEMDVSTMQKGIYLLRIQSNEGVETQKLVLQ
jgi:hypothetical protein